MLNYSDLSKAQQRWVNLVEKNFPDIKGSLTYKQIQDIHTFFTEKRKEDSRFKISKALWLITNNAVSRGVYKFPSSTVEEIEVETVIDSELEANYKAELAKFGITPRKSK